MDVRVRELVVVVVVVVVVRLYWCTLQLTEFSTGEKKIHRMGLPFSSHETVQIETANLVHIQF